MYLDFGKMFEFRVYGVPAPQGSKTAFVRGGRAVVVDGSSTTGRQKLSSWRAEVAREAVNVGNGEPLLGPVGVEINFVMPKPQSAPKGKVFCDKKPDIDKLIRSTFDSMTGVLYKDDSQIVQVKATKVYASPEEPPGAFIRIYVKDLV
jgi:crossover junction endodeoxyribonuclease RusA